jgi:uncharacterized protein (DUF849 family)
VRERYAHIDELRAAGLLRISLLDPGTVNFDGVGPDGAPGTGDGVYQTTFGDVRWMADYCREHRLAPSVSVFEPGFLRLALAYHERGELPEGAMIKLYFGGGRLLFGLPPTRASLDAYLAMLDGTGLPWLVAVLGGDVTGGDLARLAIERGGHLRVGLEDYDGPRQPRNEELVREVVALAETTGRPVATPKDASRILGLPG